MSFALLLPIAACFLWLTVAPLAPANAAPPPDAAPVVDPTALLFRRQAVQRFVFNNNLPLCKIDPTGAFDLGLMHPATAETTGGSVCQYAVESTHIVASNPSASWTYGALYLYYADAPSRRCATGTSFRSG